MAKKTNDRTGSLGFEAKLWEAADLLRSNMDPAEYKHVVLGLLFLKYLSDAFEERREELSGEVAEPESEYFVEDPDERQAELSEMLEAGTSSSLRTSSGCPQRPAGRRSRPRPGSPRSARS